MEELLIRDELTEIERLKAEESRLRGECYRLKAEVAKLGRECRRLRNDNLRMRKERMENYALACGIMKHGNRKESRITGRLTAIGITIAAVMLIMIAVSETARLFL